MSTSQENDFLAPAPWVSLFLDAIYPMVKVKLTAKQRREIAAFERHQKELRAAGLLDDWDLAIQPRDCPRYVEVADDFSKRCELMRGHDGPHRVTFESTAP